MKALIVGFGKMGMLHAAILNCLPEIDEVTVCEPSSFIREGAMTFHPKLKFCSEIDEALRRSTVDLAVISTPNKTHFEIFKKLLSKNLHLFIEKPFVTNSEEAEQAWGLVRGQTQAIPKVMMGYCLRFMPSFERAKKMISDHALGKLSRFEARMFSSDVLMPQKGWRFEKSQTGGGVLLDLGSHLTDLVRCLFGWPRRVSGSIQHRVSEHVEDHGFARFDYGDFSGTMEVCWSMPHIRKPQAEIFIEGENGSLAVTNDSLEFNSKLIDMTELAEPVPFDLGGPFYTRQLMEWVEAIQTGKPHRNGIFESVQNHRLLDAIRQSRDQWVTLKPVESNGSSDTGR